MRKFFVVYIIVPANQCPYYEENIKIPCAKMSIMEKYYEKDAMLLISKLENYKHHKII